MLLDGTLNQLCYAYIFDLWRICAWEGGILITELMKNVFKRKRENNNKKKNIFQLKEVHCKVRLRFLETRITHAPTLITAVDLT